MGWERGLDPEKAVAMAAEGALVMGPDWERAVGLAVATGWVGVD